MNDETPNRPGIVSRLSDFVARRRSGFASPEAYYEAKQTALERVLGPMHGYVGHAIIPYEIGGPVDMYYFPQPGGGTAFATQELLGYDGTGPLASNVGTYELVAFTRHKVVSPETEPKFAAVELRVRALFTMIGRYSTTAALNSGETAEVPLDGEGPNACVVFGEWQKPGVPFRIGKRDHGLLLVVEVHPTELEYAREHGSGALVEKLDAAGHWPRSDLDRDPVV